MIAWILLITFAAPAFYMLLLVL